MVCKSPIGPVASELVQRAGETDTTRVGGMEEHTLADRSADPPPTQSLCGNIVPQLAAGAQSIPVGGSIGS